MTDDAVNRLVHQLYGLRKEKIVIIKGDNHVPKKETHS